MYVEQNYELALRTVNILRNDASNRNPMVRDVALRSVCSLRLDVDVVLVYVYAFFFIIGSQAMVSKFLVYRPQLPQV